MIRDLTLIDGVTEEPRTEESVVIEDGLIVSVGGDVPGAQTIDAEARFVLPGLINMHDHLIYRNVIGDPETVGHRRPAEVALFGMRNAVDALRRGWTTTVDMASAYDVALVVRDCINRGDFVGGRILASGNPICITGGHASGSNCCLIADGPYEARRAARQTLSKGADLVKVMASHDPVSMPSEEWTRPEMCGDEIEAAFDQARRWGKLTAAHVMGERAIADVIGAGVDILHHGMYLTAELAEQLADIGAYYCPTLSAYARKTMDPVFERGDA